MDSSVKWILKMDCEEWIRLHIPQMDSAEIDFEPMDSVNGFSQNTRMDSRQMDSQMDSSSNNRKLAKIYSKC